MSAPYRSLSVLLCFTFLVGIANCYDMDCTYSGCQLTDYWAPSNGGETASYTINLASSYEMNLDVYFKPYQQTVLIYIISDLIAPATATVLWNGNSVAIGETTGMAQTSSLYMPQNDVYMDRFLRFKIVNNNFFTTKVDVGLTISSLNPNFEWAAALATYIIIIIAVVAAVVAIIIITCIICCIRRKRRLALTTRKMQSQKAALEPITVNSNANTAQVTSPPYQQHPQEMMYMQNGQYPQQPQMMAYPQQQPQYMPMYAQPQPQPQPQMQIVVQSSPQGY